MLMLGEVLSGLFVQPITITGAGRLLMLLPLTLGISIVYKTMRCERLEHIPAASLVLTIMIVVVMGLIGLGLLLFYQLLA